MTRAQAPTEAEIRRRIEAFWDELEEAPDRVLMLDYDGTLAPFRVERDQARPYPGVREVLGAVLANGLTRLVVVSGRRAVEVADLLGLTIRPEVYGAHGREHLRPDGRVESAPLDPADAKGLDRARDWAEAQGWAERLEPKPGCLAFHWRGVPPGPAARMRSEVQAAWSEAARGSGLELASFDGGLELRAVGIDKGRAVDRILAGSAPEAAAAYLGDDLTDEDAFTALSGRGERILSVLVREEWRPSRAEVWLRPPGELLEFLGRWSQIGRSGPWIS
ncbi:MAG: trehalose-phosphatase [Proteobacteria bacterium]|nr:trehalose-phosphatase [Pseudomonadota bacterium]MBU1743142.1 trehalose-phosphatase [Pseudomonadota bacterium]